MKNVEVNAEILIKAIGLLDLYWACRESIPVDNDKQHQNVTWALLEIVRGDDDLYGQAIEAAADGKLPAAAIAAIWVQNIDDVKDSIKNVATIKEISK